MKATLGCLAAIALVGLALAFYVVGQYNGLVGAEEAVGAQWAQVENAYQRRGDLVPNLVETVRGAAEFEQATLTEVVEARSRAGQISAEATAEITDDPQAFARFQAAQDALSSALSRLLVVVERYPELRAVQAFRDLMVQLEGTENRIATERRRYNEIARAFNVRRNRLPTRWFVETLGWPFEPKVYFEAVEGGEVAPRVEF